MSRRRTFALLLALLLLALSALVLTRRSGEAPVPGSINWLTLTVPDTVEAGEGFTVEVAGLSDVDLVEIHIDGGYGIRTFEGAVDQGSARVAIDPADGPESGTLLVHAVARDAVGNATIELIPAEAVDSLDLYLGPRTVIADGRDFSMIVAVPKDSFGNPVVAGTPVDYTVTRETGERSTTTGTTSGLVSYLRVFSRTTATQTRVAAEVGDASGPERSFLEVAGIPQSFELALVDEVPPADGHALARIRTETLVDEFTNQLPDGTVVYLDADGATGVRRLRSVTIEGQAEFVFEAPDRPGVATFVATASGITSSLLEVDFPTAVADLEVNARTVEIEGRDGAIEATELRIGRVISTRASYVPDGTIALVETPSGSYESPLELGATIVVVPDTSGTVTITVLGTSQSLRLDDVEGAS